MNLFGRKPQTRPPDGWDTIAKFGLIAAAFGIVVLAICLFLDLGEIEISIWLFLVIPSLAIGIFAAGIDWEVWRRTLPYNYELYETLEDEMSAILDRYNVEHDSDENESGNVQIDKHTGRVFGRKYTFTGTDDELLLRMGMEAQYMPGGRHSRGRVAYAFLLSMGKITTNNEEFASWLAEALETIFENIHASDYENLDTYEKQQGANVHDRAIPRIALERKRRN